LNSQQISVSARYRLELEIPRNPTVVLFLKIPRVLCSHPLTGGPGIFSRRWTFAWGSTISITIGKSIESRKILAVCKWLFAPKPIGPRKERRAGQSQPPRLQHDRFVKRLMVPAVALADEDSQQIALFGDSNERFSD